MDMFLSVSLIIKILIFLRIPFHCDKIASLYAQKAIEWVVRWMVNIKKWRFHFISEWMNKPIIISHWGNHRHHHSHHSVLQIKLCVDSTLHSSMRTIQEETTYLSVCLFVWGVGEGKRHSRGNAAILLDIPHKKAIMVRCPIYADVLPMCVVYA